MLHKLIATLIFAFVLYPVFAQLTTNQEERVKGVTKRFTEQLSSLAKNPTDDKAFNEIVEELFINNASRQVYDDFLNGENYTPLMNYLTKVRDQRGQMSIQFSNFRYWYMLITGRELAAVQVDKEIITTLGNVQRENIIIINPQTGKIEEIVKNLDIVRAIPFGVTQAEWERRKYQENKPNLDSLEEQTNTEVVTSEDVIDSNLEEEGLTLNFIQQPPAKIKKGNSFDINWEDVSKKNLQVSLWKGGSIVKSWDESLKSNLFTLETDDLKAGNGYTIRLTDAENDKYYVDTTTFGVKRKLPLIIPSLLVGVIAGVVYVLIPDPDDTTENGDEELPLPPNPN